jgi:hypothetical protein
MPAELLPLAVLLAIAPGYLLIYFATQGRTGKELRPDLHLVVQSLVASAGLLALFGPFAYSNLWPIRDHLDRQPLLVFAWLVGIFLVAPYLAGRAARGIGAWLEEYPKGRLTRAMRAIFGGPQIPTLWDWAEVNDLMDNRFLVIEYRDGRRIAGAHGQPGVTLTSPEPHGIYLAIEYDRAADGRLAQLTDTAGVLVPITDDVRCVHLFEPPGGHQRRTARQGPRSQRNGGEREGEERGIRPHREDPPSIRPEPPSPPPPLQPPPPPPPDHER